MHGTVVAPITGSESDEVLESSAHPCCRKCVDLQRQLDMVLAANRTIMDEMDVAKNQVSDLTRIHGVDTAYLNQT